jgi:hypothetical protein
VLSLRLRPAAVAGLVLFLLGTGPDLDHVLLAGRDAGAAHAQVPTAAPEATPGQPDDVLKNWPPKTIEPTLVPPTLVPTAASDTPVVPAARVTAGAAAMLDCKQLVATLASGNVFAFASLPAQRKDALTRGTVALRAFTCLAIAEDSDRYCEVLQGSQKDDCVSQRQFVRGLKSLPKESVKAATLYRMCLEQDTPGQCEKLRDAIAAHSPDKCSGVTKPSTSAFCTAIAAADPTKCDGLAEVSDRDQCAALATDDASRCPKDWADCVTLVQGLAKAKREGTLEQIDPEFAAASKGKSACAPFLTSLETLCADAQTGTTVTPAPTPVRTAAPPAE